MLMTFTVVAHCEETGRIGAATATKFLAVGALRLSAALILGFA